jgi:flagellar basal body rod protein FlgC
MSLFSLLSVSASGMAAQRTRAELVIQNLANSETHADARRRALPAAGRGF